MSGRVGGISRSATTRAVEASPKASTGTPEYQVAILGDSSSIGYRPYGGALELWKCKDHEIVIAGPAETGKTRACLEKLDSLCWKYPGMQGAIVRKSYRSAIPSVIQTYKKKVLGGWHHGQFSSTRTPVLPYGGEKPEWFEYPNGSQIFVCGMDNADKVLSSERDVIYVNQAEELDLNDWEVLKTRCTGRAGNMPFPQLIGDCNPGPPTHWILDRNGAGVLTLIESRFEDNPVLFDPVTGEITEQGRRTLSTLDELSGIRKERLRHGRWVQAEGAVYEDWDQTVHMIDPFEIPRTWRKFRVVDFGYTNPFVCGWFALDNDDRLYLYRQHYMSQWTVKAHSTYIKKYSPKEERYEATVADHDAEDRATLHENDIITIPAMKDVAPGIQAVQERLKKAGDGKPRFFILRGGLVQEDYRLRNAHKPINAEQEFPGYAWPIGVSGKAVKEAPIKENDHGMDIIRYAAQYANKRGAHFG